MDRDQFQEPLLVFDGDCGFCRAWVDYWKGLTSDRVKYAPFQEVGERFPQVSREKFASAVKHILPGGEVRSGERARFWRRSEPLTVRTALGRFSGKEWPDDPASSQIGGYPLQTLNTLIFTFDPISDAHFNPAATRASNGNLNNARL